MSHTMHLQYTSVADLVRKARLDYKGKNPFSVYRRLSDMRDIALDARKKGDEEVAFIMLSRWLDAVNWLKKTTEYKDDKSFYHMHMNEVKNILADLNRRLDARYKRSAREKILRESSKLDIDLDIDTDMEIDSYMPSVDGTIRLPETPTKDPLAEDNEEYVTCDQLYLSLHKTDSRCLIIDIRPKEQYEESRLLSNRCINIPDSEILGGVLPLHFEKYLCKDRKSYDLFMRRGAQYVDLIILLDLNTTSGSIAPTSKLNLLKQILEKWDQGVKYKRIAVLDGGYCEWLVRYPAFTTNPNLTEPISKNSVQDEILEDIKYPEWVPSDDEEGGIQIRDLRTNNAISTKKEPVPAKITMVALESQDEEMEIDSNVTRNRLGDYTSISRPSDVDGSVPDNTATARQGRVWSGLNKQTDMIGKPTIDRSSKPVALKPRNDEAKIVLKLMRQATDLAKIKKELEEETLEQERSLHVQHGLNTNSDEEECINGNLKSLYAKLEDTESGYSKIEEELAAFSKEMELIEFTSAEKGEKDKLDINLMTLKWRMKKLAEERKKLREKPVEEPKDPPSKEIANNIHKERLKTDSATMPGGLERSYSSPNLLQLGDKKAPRIDRTSKPQIPTRHRNVNDNAKVSHISWANREERMAPVHGSVHPGITGLKNLGNSCYMNSIIQCLSNTTHLAKYFTDNLYADDLNTSDSTTQGQVVEEVAQVIKALWRGQYKSISPHDLKVAVGQYKLQFESFEQQDSHEFLTFLLDWMHNDLRKEYKPPLDMTVAEKAWDKAMASQRSIISDLFFGQLKSTITCGSCKQGSTTYETFNSLTTSLPHSSRCTLNDCVIKFVTGQKVLGWKCPKCQMSRDATKKFDFVKLAPVIVIHLNRFAESGGWLEKRNTAVDFPLTGFNLKPYLVADGNGPTISNIRGYNYSLYAMSNHYGTMEGGHYTAFCKNAAQNKWYKYDDQTVTEVTASQVKSQNTSAYLLFYTSFSSNIIN